jgi:predicted nucleotidyltransferase
MPPVRRMPSHTARRRRALRVARAAAEVLRRDFGAGRIIVFGSLARSGHFTAWSDIDLAAWGIPPELFYAAVARVTGLSTEFKVDLLDPESCSASLRERVECEGQDL